MIGWLWSDHAMALAIVWAVLAAVWLVALPRDKTRWVDRLYPLAPLIVAVLHAWDALPPGFAGAWLQVAVWLWVSLTGVWIISLIKKDASIMDIAYGLLLLALPWWVYGQLAGVPSPSAWWLLAMATVGFGRYSLYILWRNLPHGEDPRYARWRERSGARWWWFSYFQVFLLQGVVIWVWSVPLVLALLQPGPVGLWHWLGAAAWAVGFIFEAGGDWQLTRFKRTRADRSQLLDTGLWALTRHPNYFGQTCMWWGYGLVALSHPLGLLALLPVVYVTWFMHEGSATSLMERHMARTKPGYADYCARVPAFFPRLWPSRAGQPGDHA